MIRLFVQLIIVDILQEHSPGCAKKETLCSSDKPSVDPSDPAAPEAPVIKWLRSLGLAKYETSFMEQEIDWESLQWLTEEVCFVVILHCHTTMIKKKIDGDLPVLLE